MVEILVIDILMFVFEIIIRLRVMAMAIKVGWLCS